MRQPYFIELSLAEYFLCDKFRIAIVLVFAVLFFPPALVLVEDLNLISAFETDPGSIFGSLNTMLSLDNFYNQNAGYHSKHYGWSFHIWFFWLVLPVKAISFLFGFDELPNIYLFYRVIHFSLSLLTALLFYEVAKKISTESGIIIARCLTLLFVVSPFSFFFYFVHPEVAGLMYFLAAFLLFSQNTKTFDKKWERGFIAIVTLCALSKQVFLIICLPMAFVYLWRKWFITYEGEQLKVKLQWFCRAVGFSILVFFLVHPMAFFEFGVFFKTQVGTFNHFSSKEEVSFIDNLLKWLVILKDQTFYLLLLGLGVIASILNIIRTKFQPNHFQSDYVLVLTGIVFIIAVAAGNNSNFSKHYMYPLVPILLLQIPFAISEIGYVFRKRFNRFFEASTFYIFVVAFIGSFYSTVDLLLYRMDYRNTPAYHTFAYVKDLTKTLDVRLAHDHFVAFPGHTVSSCSYWQQCSTLQGLAAFAPNYILLRANPIWPGYKEHENLIAYAQSNNFTELDRIEVGKRQGLMMESDGDTIRVFQSK